MPSWLKGSIASCAAILAISAATAWLDVRFGAVATAFDFIAHQFYEIPMLASIRRPSQIALVRVHLPIFASLAFVAAAVSPFLSKNGRSFFKIFLIGYAIRAVVWIVGGNLPLVPGDSCHYLEVAESVYRGEGPVKHYVESYFIDYPEIRANKGILDDWATPLYAYVLAGAYRLTGVVPGESIEATVAVSKGTSFVIGLLTLPLLFGFARRRYTTEVALAATAMLSIIPVHVLYAGLGLRESLVAFACVAAVWLLTEIDSTEGIASWLCAIAGGVAAGCAILARDAAIALVAALAVYALVRFGKSRPGRLLVWGFSAAVVVAPWAWATAIRYGKPFYTYTQYFQYTFSWTIHHYQEGIPRAADFYTRANAPSIIRVKIKSLFIIVTVSTMILGPPLVYGIARRFLSGRRDGITNSAGRIPSGGEIDRLVVWLFFVFAAATLARVADITQVTQLGRYYLAIFVVAIPTAAAGLIDFVRAYAIPPNAWKRSAILIPVIWWADPTWSYDYTWFTKPYQLHWLALREAGDWIKTHPDEVPREARVMTWFPWELRLASDRPTILMPRSFYPSVAMQAERLDRAIRQYGVTHVLWGSFETPPHADPETFGPYLDRVRSTTLAGAEELMKSKSSYPYPVRLYRLGSAPAKAKKSETARSRSQSSDSL